MYGHHSTLYGVNDAERELLDRRREIAEAAIAIADENGIEAVSMRNIAARLGVGTMTLYTWVENKDDVIGVMGEALVAQMLVPEPLPEDWRAALTLIATATRDTFASHPWMLSRERRPGRLGASILRHVDQSLRAVAGLDIDWQLRASILQAVDHYALGYAASNQRLRERREQEAERAGDRPDYGAAFAKVSANRAHRARTEVFATRADAAHAIEVREMFESGETPALTEMFGSPDVALDRIRQGPPEIETAFDDGLGWMLDGIAAMLEKRSAR